MGNGKGRVIPWFRYQSIRPLYPREELIWALMLLNQISKALLEDQ